MHAYRGVVRASWGGKKVWDIYPSVKGLPHCKHTSSYMTAAGAEESVKGRGRGQEKDWRGAD